MTPALLAMHMVLALTPSQDGLREQIYAAHRESRERISTLHVEFEQANIEVGEAAQGTMKTKVSWWQDGDKFSSQIQYDVNFKSNPSTQSRKEFTAKSDKMIAKLQQQLGESNDTTPQAELRPPRAEIESSLDNPWSRALFDLMDTPRRSFLDLIGQREFVKDITEADSPSGKLYRIHLLVLPQRIQYVIWVNVRRNYLVERVSIEFPDGRSRLEASVRKYAEPKPGIFFPSEIEHATYKDKKLLVRSRAFFSTIEVNDPIDSSVFELAIPDGTLVLDYRDGTQYTSKDGGPNSLGRHPLHQINLSKTPPVSRQGSWTALILYIALIALLILGFAAWRLGRTRTMADRPPI